MEVITMRGLSLSRICNQVQLFHSFRRVVLDKNVRALEQLHENFFAGGRFRIERNAQFVHIHILEQTAVLDAGISL